MDGIHSAWLKVDATDKEEARRMLPPAFRTQAKIIGLNKFDLAQIETMLAEN